MKPVCGKLRLGRLVFRSGPAGALPTEARLCYSPSMSNVAEIEAAIEKLPRTQVDQLARWIEEFRQQRATPPPVESWLQHARGAAIPGMKTQDVMKLTRGEQ